MSAGKIVDRPITAKRKYGTYLYDVTHIGRSRSLDVLATY